MLSENQRKHLKNFRELRNNADNSEHPVTENCRLRKMNERIREKALDALEDLTLIAKMMPENQKQQLFTKEIMWDFIQNILVDGDLNYPEHREAQSKSTNLFTNNDRIFNLGKTLADFGIGHAYKTLSEEQILRDTNKSISKGAMWETLNTLEQFGHKLNKKK
jgi:hypothetical protein